MGKLEPKNCIAKKCKGDPVVKKFWGIHYVYYYVKCRKCGIQQGNMSFSRPENAVKNWNRRAE